LVVKKDGGEKRGSDEKEAMKKKTKNKTWRPAA